MTLVEGLTAAGYDVQLQHDDTETSWDSHGWVSICGPDGSELSRREAVQHNKHWSDRKETMATMVQEVIEKLSPVSTTIHVAASPTLERTASVEAAAAV